MRSATGTPGLSALVLFASLFSFASFGSFACSSTQVVEDAGGCADPCCNGISARIDCGEHPMLTCTEKGDPCTANRYGCVNGEFFSKPPSPLPSHCIQADAGND